MESRVSKRQYVDMYNNKKRQSLDEYKSKSKGEDVRYIPLPFLPFQKESNYPINIGEQTKSLNHLVYISKIGSLYNY